jgi:hypothetical protein
MGCPTNPEERPRSREDLAEERGGFVIAALAEGVAAEGATSEEDREVHRRRAEEAVELAAAVPEPAC